MLGTLFDGEGTLNPRRVLLVDRNDDFLDGITLLLADAHGVQIVGRAHSGREAIERAAELAPDLVLMDVTLDDMSGFQAVPWLKGLRPAPRVLLLTFHDSRASESAAIAAGADGCLSKSEVAQRLLPLVELLLWPDVERTARAIKRQVRMHESSTKTER